MTGKLLYAGIVIIALLFLVSAALAIMLDEENRALRSELDAKEQLLQSTQEELYEKVALLREKDSQIEQQKANISALSADLEDKNQEITSLQQQLSETESRLAEAETTLQEAEEEISAIKDETVQMAERIDQSLGWFSDNSELPHTLKVDRFISKVERGCIEDKANLACISHLMEVDLGMQYKVDPGGDRLYSIDEIIDRKGGDCEDYSLFFKAVLNRLDGMELEAWKEGIGRYDVYTDMDTYTIWYYDDAYAESMGEDLNPYVACYYYDQLDHTWIGHCIIMLTGKDISSPEDISPEKLSDAQFFEPQNGKYVGKIGSEFGICVDGQEGCEEIFNNIVFIITDEDLFEFSEGKWNYYGGYLERTEMILAELDSIIT